MAFLPFYQSCPQSQPLLSSPSVTLSPVDDEEVSSANVGVTTLPTALLPNSPPVRVSRFLFRECPLISPFLSFFCLKKVTCLIMETRTSQCCTKMDKASRDGADPAHEHLQPNAPGPDACGWGTLCTAVLPPAVPGDAVREEEWAALQEECRLLSGDEGWEAREPRCPTGLWLPRQGLQPPASQRGCHVPRGPNSGQTGSESVPHGRGRTEYSSGGPGQL